ncbi:hypothetical protein ST47_g2339 [Ascochyta rabiei]|uniref:Uncharacterized protein n=1 Tax=Didymella rabiei TaxID=5454 RepID=A0A163JVA2_DIDRA|nr:hypothetical protein ST47_g2339 [Ascochyta rabiei]
MFYKDTHEECIAGSRDQPHRIDLWDMPFAADASEEERIGKCKADVLAEISARETSGVNNFVILELRGHDYQSWVTLIID